MCETVLTICANCGADIGVEFTRLADKVFCVECGAKLILCAECGEVVALDDSVSGYCQSCYDEQFATCDGCNEDFPVDDITESPNGRKHFCSDCYNERFTTCHSCENDCPVDDCHDSEDGNSYCSDCYSDLYTHCNRCNCEIDRERALCDNDGDEYCSDCYSDKEGENWDTDRFSPSTCYDEIRSHRRFGIELETSDCPSHEDLRLVTCFGCKDDDSIGGKEFISPILSSDRGLEVVREFRDRRVDSLLTRSAAITSTLTQKTLTLPP